MDFTLSPRIEEFRTRIAAFVESEILPVEADRSTWDAHENIGPEALSALRAKAKAAGLWCLQLKPETGGQGLGKVGMAACYTEMNRSIFGPVVFNSAAPDDGNMMVLEALGTPEQKARWLEPIVSGAVRSAFAMTEPHPGGGSDPSMIQTRAERQPDGSWRISGRKWYITGAEDAAHFILIARTSDDPRYGLTAFLFHRDQPGWEIVRRIPIMGPEEHGGHCELVFDGLTIKPEDVLGGEGKGLKVTQVRLGPARLTHCMRWLGLAGRCVEIAQEYAAKREGFGVRLADRESVQLMLGGLAMDIEIGRLLVMRAAWELDQGRFARKEVSMAKVHVANTLHRAADIGIQINGARGYSKDTVLEWIYRYARQARLVDGADEVHRMVLNRHLEAEGRGFFAWPTAQA
jgi:acyl-CoA dehydrogenase